MEVARKRYQKRRQSEQRSWAWLVWPAVFIALAAHLISMEIRMRFHTDLVVAQSEVIKALVSLERAKVYRKAGIEVDHE